MTLHFWTPVFVFNPLLIDIAIRGRADCIGLIAFCRMENGVHRQMSLHNMSSHGGLRSHCFSRVSFVARHHSATTPAPTSHQVFDACCASRVLLSLTLPCQAYDAPSSKRERPCYKSPHDHLARRPARAARHANAC